MREEERPTEFWQEETRRSRKDFRRAAFRIAGIFSGVLALLFVVNWWAGSAVRFGASRVEESTPATYRISGRVTDARTARPIPWVEIGDDMSGRPPFFHTRADSEGRYELVTIAEPHTIRVTALGYRAFEERIGQPWYLWSPRGSEKLDIRLEPD